jgi:signal transduction histidine kinase
VLHIFSVLGSIADKPTDDTQAMIRNRIFVYTAVIMSFGGLLWGSIALYFDLYFAAMIPYGYVLLTVINFSFLAYYGHRKIARFVQIYLSLLLPFIFQWILGGFMSSGAIMIWCEFGIIISLLTVRNIRITFVVFIIAILLVIFSAYIDDNLAVPSILQTNQVQSLFFAVNFIVVGSGLFVIIGYLVQSKDALAVEIANKSNTLKEVLLNSIQEKDQRAKDVAIANKEKVLIQQVAEKAKSEFISTMNHELRTPLTAIKGALGLMQAGVLDKSPEKIPAIIDIAYKNADRLHHLINDILDIERLNVGKMNFQMESVEVSSLLEEAALSIESYGSQYGVTFVNSYTDELLYVNGDHHRLIQVMANLLSNAAKFSHRDGQVDVFLTRHNGSIRVSVQDYGIGIPESARASIFDNFTQVDSSDQRHTGGSGLGLGIAKNIVEAHEGHIDFISEVDKGTTFYFDLPEFTTSQA